MGTPCMISRAVGHRRLMPHEAIPDPSCHRMCRRCRRWFKPEEGTLLAPEPTGPLGMMRSLRATVSGDSRGLRFQCHRCSRIRRTTQITLWALLLAMLAIVLVLDRLGVFHR